MRTIELTGMSQDEYESLSDNSVEKQLIRDMIRDSGECDY
jgi:hypothetical protein